MKKDSLSKRTFSLDFKHQVLIDYYRSGSTKYFIEKKYGLHCGTMHRWEKAFVLSEKDLSLSDELLIRLSKMRQALEYSELRNEALNEVLKIGREEYGVDLLKKAGAKQ